MAIDPGVFSLAVNLLSKIGPVVNDLSVIIEAWKNDEDLDPAVVSLFQSRGTALDTALDELIASRREEEGG